MIARKLLAVTAAMVMGAAGLTACSGGDEGGGSGSSGDTQMTFWHNSTTGDGKAYWEATVKDFEAANPGVKIKIQSIQNEDMDGKLQTALNSGDAPDIFMARGGGKLADVVAAGQAQEITVDDATKAQLSDAAFSAFTVDGKIYGMPMSVLPGGIYYSKDLFEQAGITETPETIEDLSAAVDKLKAAGISPIALGAKDAWPAAHWYYFFALRACSQDTLDKVATDMNVRRPVLAEGGRRARRLRRDGAVQPGLPHHRRAAGCGFVRGPDRQPPGRHGAHGCLEPGRDRVPDAGQEAAGRPRLVPLPGHRRR